MKLGALFSRHADLEAHFAGRSSTRSDRHLFRHLKGCGACRDEYRTLAMLEELEVDGPARAQARLRRGLFEPAPNRVFVGGGLAVAFASLVLVVSLGHARGPLRSDGPSDRFAARGGVPGLEGATLPSLSIYRVPRDLANPAALAVSQTQRAGGIVRVGESLAFSYTNPPAVSASFVMIFARDAAGHVAWFWPAWDNADDDPTSLPISTSDTPVELTEAVRHDLAPGPLTIVGLFTPRPLHVREVEGAVANGLSGLQDLPGHVWTETLEVTR